MDFKIKPWAHQLKSINNVLDNDLDYRALLLDLGAGKTKTVIEILRGKCAKHGRLLNTLIVCPVAVLHNWKREILTHSHIDEKEIQIIDGTSPVKSFDKPLKNPTPKRLLEQLLSGKKIFIINTEKVGNANAWGGIIDFKPEFLIVDEAHRFKDAQGKRAKALFKMLDTCKTKYRFILTGSPILNSPMDIWAQFYIINPEIFGKNFYSFRSQYFYDANASMPSNIHFPDWRVKDEKFYKRLGMNLTEKDTLNTLNEIIYKHADRVMKSEVLDLPPMVYSTREVPLTKEQERIYSDMEEDAVASINDKKIDISNLENILKADFAELDSSIMSADTALVKLLRMQQIIAGVFVNDETKEVKPINSNRLKVLEETLEEILANFDNKVIIWSVFASTYELIADVCKKLKVEYTLLTGLQSSEEKQKNIDNFNNNPNCRVIIANQGAGGTGTNLVSSNYSIYFTRSFKLEHDLQSEARNYRGGQKRSVTRIDLVTPNTIDADILEALARKKELAEDILAVRKEFTPNEILGLLKKK